MTRFRSFSSDRRWVYLTATLVFAAGLAGWQRRGESAEPSSRGREQRLQERFQQFDKNRDGVLQREEIPRLFDRLDANGDGQVTMEEVRARFRRAERGSGRRGAPSAEELANIKTTLDVPYAEGAGRSDRLLRLDIYAPKQGAGHPVVIYVHGGGWRVGDKRAVHRKVPFFPDRGYVFVSVNYRLVPQVDVATEAQDVANAIAWVHDHIPQYGGDPTRLFLMGHSAGAHLIALVATNDEFLKKAGKNLAILRGVIPLDTQAYDLVALMSNRPARVYRTAFGDDRNTWERLSPIHHVRAGKRIPPFLICFSRGLGRTANPRRKASAEKFARALKAAGVQADIVDASDRNHGEINQWLGRPDDKVTSAVMAFLESLQEKPSANGQ
ncbi:MAG: alpha/beta hydrolase fold domain-containing protein [Planctomycetes bacterium]|nr:alpha/beta hydrolase fold domain-containing protein [Planctomycetota bacterium]